MPRKTSRIAGVVTASGWTVIGLTVASYVLGSALGWIELVGLAAGGAIGLTLSLTRVLGRFNMQIERTIDPVRVEVGTGAVGLVRFTNPTRRTSAARTAEDRVGDGIVLIHLPALARGTSSETTYILPTQRRAVLDVGPLTMTMTDPIGLFRRERTHSGVSRLWIHPRVHRLDMVPAGRARDLDGPTFDSSPQGSAAFHTLRDYVPGDERRHIHWRSTARTGRLTVKHYVDNRRPSLAIVLDVQPDSYDASTFELAVEAAASVAVSGMWHGYPVSVDSSDGRSMTASATEVPALLDSLAAVTTTDEGELSQSAQLIRRRRESATTFVLVTGERPPEQLLAFMRQLPRVRTIILRCVGAVSQRPLRLTGADVVDVANADDLVVGWNRVVRS